MTSRPIERALARCRTRRRAGTLFRLAFRGLHLSAQAAPRLVAWSVACGVVSGAGAAATVVFGEQISRGILGGEPLAAMAPAAVALLLVVGLMGVSATVTDAIAPLLGERVGRKSSAEVLRVVGNVDLLAMESTDFYDRCQRAQFNAAQWLRRRPTVLEPPDVDDAIGEVDLVPG